MAAKSEKAGKGTPKKSASKIDDESAKKPSMKVKKEDDEEKDEDDIEEEAVHVKKTGKASSAKGGKGGMMKMRKMWWKMKLMIGIRWRKMKNGIRILMNSMFQNPRSRKQQLAKKAGKGEEDTWDLEKMNSRIWTYSMIQRTKKMTSKFLQNN